MHIVRSNPNTVRSVLQLKAMAQPRLMKKNPCRCAEFRKHAAHYGAVIDVDGQVALVPVALNVGGHGGLRPNDPVPVPGPEARDKAVSGMKSFSTHPDVPVPPPDILPPNSLFPETGTLLRQLRCLSAFIASFQYIRIIDKGSGELWGSCSAWVWEKVTKFMINEKFEHKGCTQNEWAHAIGDAISGRDWNATSMGNCVSFMCWLKQSHAALRNGFSEEYMPSLPPSCSGVSYGRAHEPSRVCFKCCRPKSHTSSSTQTSRQSHDGCAS